MWTVPSWKSDYINTFMLKISTLILKLRPSLDYFSVFFDLCCNVPLWCSREGHRCWRVFWRAGKSLQWSDGSPAADSPAGCPTSPGLHRHSTHPIKYSHTQKTQNSYLHVYSYTHTWTSFFLLQYTDLFLNKQLEIIKSLSPKTVQYMSC